MEFSRWRQRSLDWPSRRTKHLAARDFGRSRGIRRTGDSMKMTARALAALLATAVAAPVLAQTSGGSRGAANEAPPPTEETEAPANPDPAGAIKPSKGAYKAIIELQNAVNANDTANIPAKLAGAQAVATTKEDKYL